MSSGPKVAVHGRLDLLCRVQPYWLGAPFAPSLSNGLTNMAHSGETAWPSTSRVNCHSALLTDLYEITMAAGYYAHRIDARATFELFVRRLPRERSFLLACGLDAALEYLENFQFTAAEVDYLRGLPGFRTVPPSFFDYLQALRFSGDVWAVPEGTPVFGEEPILQVTAPLAEAQMVETYLLSVVNFETLIATKAARVCHAANGKGVLEFGTRRAQGPEAGFRAARAAYIGGCEGTSNVLAGFHYGIPVYGTAAHSWTQAFPTEQESFEALLDTFPETAILLIDTYDPLAAAEIAGRLGRPVPGVRLDSGDLFEQSLLVRAILDRHGLTSTKIIASGDLNEFKVEDLVSRGAPIDLFGVGTELATSRDLPALNVVYKLVETKQGEHKEYKTKFSEQKAYLPGRKQVFRYIRDGFYDHDLICRAYEKHPGAAGLLELAMKDGQRVALRLPASTIRQRALENLRQLPAEYQALQNASAYPVEKSEAIEKLLEEVRERHFGAAEDSLPGRAL
jgi:nicotinate phosphoribosyltransferase